LAVRGFVAAFLAAPVDVAAIRLAGVFRGGIRAQYDASAAVTTTKPPADPASQIHATPGAIDLRHRHFRHGLFLGAVPGAIWAG
jgi:hypothetical protein